MSVPITAVPGFKVDLDLRDRAYIVTGASSGLGFSCAELLVREQAHVVVASRNRCAIVDAARKIGHGGRARAVVTDLADASSPAMCIDASFQHYGRLDGAIISVGGPPASTAMDTSDSEWRSAFDTVFLGALRMAREVARAMERGGGSIVFVLSSSVRTPLEGLAVSNGLRPGLAMVAKTLADELGPQGIRVNALSPGRIDTARVRAIDATRGDPASVRDTTMARIPLRRYGFPEEFARAAVFLLSPAASYISGIAMPVDGGMSRCL